MEWKVFLGPRTPAQNRCKALTGLAPAPRYPPSTSVIFPVTSSLRTTTFGDGDSSPSRAGMGTPLNDGFDCGEKAPVAFPPPRLMFAFCYVETRKNSFPPDSCRCGRKKRRDPNREGQPMEMPCCWENREKLGFGIWRCPRVHFF